MNSTLFVLAAAVVGVAVIAGLAGLAITRLYRKVPQGQALIISRSRDVAVTFTGGVVIPFLHLPEFMDISVKTVKIERRGSNGLVCRDNIRADIAVEFYVKVNAVDEAVRTVARTIGCERASDIVTLRELFESKFSEALKTAGKQFDFEQLYTDRARFRDMVVELIGEDLSGYVLEDVAIDDLEQTKLENLDPNNILDAEGIRKITERTAVQHIETNNARETEREQTTRRTVDADKSVFEMERDRAEAAARQDQEIRTVQARADAAAAEVEANERQRAEAARIAADQAVGVAGENRDREIAIASLNKDRTVAVTTEEIERDRQLAVVGRDTAIADASKAAEISRRELATVSRERVVADLSVAEQEEKIKTLRTIEDASRTADATVRIAEGDAQAAFVGTVKQAEAGQAAAESEAARMTTLAAAAATAAESEALAARREAEGRTALAAAEGLAGVHVDRERAAAIREVGAAEGDAVQSRLAGEGEGLVAKAHGVAAMSQAGRAHEEFRLSLEANVDVAKTKITAQADIAKSAAEALGTSLSNADIKIVSTDQIVERILSAAGHGAALDGFLGSSDGGTQLMRPYLEGDANLVSDVAAGLGGIGASGIRDLSVARLIEGLRPRLAATAGGAEIVDLLDAAVADGRLDGTATVGDVVGDSPSA